MNALSGKVALVFGAASGIGAAVVRRFVFEGAAVVASGTPLPVLDDSLLLTGAIALRCDVTDDEQVRATVANTIARYDRIDVLVNAAGVIANDDAAEIADAAWSRQHEINLGGTMRTMRAVLPPYAGARRGCGRQRRVRGGLQRRCGLGQLRGEQSRRGCAHTLRCTGVWHAWCACQRSVPGLGRYPDGSARDDRHGT